MVYKLSWSDPFIWGHTNLPGSVGQWLDWILWQKVVFLSDVHSDTELIVLLSSFNTGGSCVTENISSTWIETLQRTLLVTQFNGKKTLLPAGMVPYCSFKFLNFSHCWLKLLHTMNYLLIKHVNKFYISFIVVQGLLE